MAVNYDAIELGKTLGKNIQTVDVQNQNAFDSESVTALNIVGINSISLSTSVFVYKQVLGGTFIIGHSTYGILGASGYPMGNTMIWGHPVLGLWGSSLWGSTTVLSRELMYSAIN